MLRQHGPAIAVHLLDLTGTRVQMYLTPKELYEAEPYEVEAYARMVMQVHNSAPSNRKAVDAIVRYGVLAETD